MITLLAAIALAPWAHPLAFHSLPGWSTGKSGNVSSRYGGRGWESTAWIATGNVHYANAATDDPPNKTLAHLPPTGIIVWAVIYSPAVKTTQPIELDLAKATHHACCEGADVAGGELELTGIGAGKHYAVIVRVYFGSRPTSALRSDAQRALYRLDLPLRR